MTNKQAKAALLDDLRRRIAHLEHPALDAASGPLGTGALPLGVAEIDSHLPWGGLAPAALHEITSPKGACLPRRSVLPPV